MQIVYQTAPSAATSRWIVTRREREQGHHCESNLHQINRTSLLESEQGSLRNRRHLCTLFQCQVGPIHLPCARSIFPSVLF